MRYRRYFVRQGLNIALCVVSAALCYWINHPVLTVILWALAALVNLEWALVVARRAHLRRIGGWMKL